MARIVVCEEKRPYVYKDEKPVSLCMCGLSGDRPFCDGSHQETKSEEDGKMYHYVNGERREIEIEKVEV